MSASKRILIVGAGPTGLTAAVELYRRGFTPRIIDRKAAPSPLSRAVGISAHSLDLLHPSGITPRLLAAGYKIKHASIHEAGRIVGTLDFEQLDHPYNFLLALPQNETEEVMSDVLCSLGGTVEYNHALTTLTVEGNTAHVAINDDPAEPYDLVIGADGIHSAVRHAAGIGFDGYDYPTRWSIADIDSTGWDDMGMANLFLLPGGHVRFVVKIGPSRYRIVADQPDALSDIPVPLSIDSLHRADNFVISVRQAPTYQKHPVYLAGDAAHVHSPAGGRGMNLGIEDACDLARRIADDDLAGYTALRHPIGARWIRISEKMVRGATAARPLPRMVRRGVLWAISILPRLQKPLLRRVAGLSE